MSASITRREALVTIAATCAAGLSGAGCAGVATYRVTASGAGGSRGVEVPLAEFERLTLERKLKAIRVEAPDLPEPVLLFRLEGEAGFRALGSTCTHQQCAVRPASGFVRCGCHGSTFDLTGAVVRGPAPRDLPMYAATADATTIRLSTTPS